MDKQLDVSLQIAMLKADTQLKIDDLTKDMTFSEKRAFELGYNMISEYHNQLWEIMRDDTR